MIRGMDSTGLLYWKTESNRKDNNGGADHGLELDAFNIGAVNVLKGPPHCSMAVMQWE